MIGTVDVSAYLDELELHGIALAEAADAAGLAAPVPTCPGWEMRNLLAHIGMVHRWAAGIVRGEPDAKRHSDFPAPEVGVVEWFRDGHTALVAALRAAPADLEAWAFMSAPSPLAFWARRQAHETAIHRADAESALGAVPAFATDFALDGISELLGGFLTRRGGKLKADPGFVLRVAPADADESWTIAVGSDGATVSTEEHGPADCTISGSASALYLDLWNRSTPRSVTLSGDPHAMELWRDLATVSWS
jgi:uncharacterized protein (TIGR03083 family)